MSDVGIRHMEWGWRGSVLDVTGLTDRDLKNNKFFIFSTPKIGSDDVKTVGLISFIKRLLGTYYIIMYTLSFDGLLIFY